MLLSRFRRTSTDVTVAIPGPPDPTDPAELGLLLRATRERSALTLDEIRDRIAVPRVDLVALESGRLSLLHTERAASIALWRYADLLGLDAEALVRIVHTHWPRPTQGALSIQPFVGIELPVGQITHAQDLLRAITGVRERSTRARPLGLSASTRSTLSSISARRNLGYEILGPVRPSRRRPSARSKVALEDETPEVEPLAELGPADVTTPAPIRPEDAFVTDEIVTVDQVEEQAISTDTVDDHEGLGATAEVQPAPESGSKAQAPDLEAPEVPASERPVEAPDVSDPPLTVAPAPSAGVPSFPLPQVPIAPSPVAKAKQIRDRATRRFRLTGKKSDSAAAAEDDAALQSLLANVPADRHETLLRSAVDQLEPVEREALRLVIWDELSHSAAAARLAISEAELLVLLKRARSAFRRALVELADSDA
jgi:cytoskeletal protein RodZ